jgi:hypothetical protein
MLRLFGTRQLVVCYITGFNDVDPDFTSETKCDKLIIAGDSDTKHWSNDWPYIGTDQRSIISGVDVEILTLAWLLTLGFGL